MSTVQSGCFNGHIGREIHKRLLDEGYEPAKNFNATCKVAAFEKCVQKDNHRVYIVESDLFGQFTQVDQYYQ